MDISPELKIVNKYFKEHFPFVLEVSDAGPPSDITPNRMKCKILGYREFKILDICMYVSPTHFCELMDYRIEEKVNQRMKLLTSTFLKSVFTDWKGDELRLLFFPEINEQTILNQLTSLSE
jgi:hypothetical protein